jgi:hypothetical protein
MIRVSSYTEAGGHPENEDAFDVRLHPQDQESYLGVVADGQGGRAGGAVAAKLASQACLEAAAGYAPAQLIRPQTWAAILRTVDEAVYEHSGAGFTTLVGFYVTPDLICGASCGDSAMVVLNAKEPGKVLTARQYKNPPVGSRAGKFVSFTSNLIRPWMTVAMTDGVWKYAGWEAILQIASEMPGQKIVDWLRDRARLQGSGGLQDDFTLVVLQQGMS